jgi:hypothetical protein
VKKPISPSEVAGLKATLLPDEVIEAFNELIAKNASNGRSEFTQSTVVSLILKKLPGWTKAQLHAERCLDVEDIYRAAGWKVEYDKPGYNEDYEARFVFSYKRA